MATPVLKAAKNGQFYAFWSENRRSKRKSMNTTDRREAEKKFGHWLMLGGASAAPQAAQLTVSWLWPIYERKHLMFSANPGAERAKAKNVLVFFGHVTAEEIDQDMLDAYVKARTAGNVGRPSTLGTVRKELVMLRACFNWHASPDRGKAWLLRVADVPRFRLPEASPPRDRWLTTEEIARLLDVAGRHSEIMDLFIRLALETAARKTAIRELTWDRVDFETGMVHFAVPGRRQTSKKRVSVPISAALRKVLEKASRCAIYRPTVIPKTVDVDYFMRVIVFQAGLEGVSPHTLRHTAATHMARRGVPLFYIAGVLGNSLAVVEATYAKHCPGELLAAVNAISGPSAERPGA